MDFSILLSVRRPLSCSLNQNQRVSLGAVLSAHLWAGAVQCLDWERGENGEFTAEFKTLKFCSSPVFLVLFTLGPQIASCSVYSVQVLQIQSVVTRRQSVLTPIWPATFCLPIGRSWCLINFNVILVACESWQGH